MTQIENAVSKRNEKSFSRNKKQILRIDMTPMVDLGFLLITFFVFTTTVSTPKATDLFMPKDDTTKPQLLPKSFALSLLLDENNKIYYYNGDMDDALKAHEIFETNFSTYTGIGKIIREKQKELVAKKFKEGRNGMMLLIKPAPGSVYRNLVDALDEAIINDVKKYAIIEPGKQEIDFLRAKSGQ